MEKMEEILLLLAYLAIGLMSITVPTYAISVSYLARETAKTLEEMRKRRNDLGEKLSELKEKLKKEPGVEGIKEEIKKFEEEEAQLKDRLECLSVKGAVGFPFGAFALGLVFAASGIYASENVSLYVLASIGSVAYGLYRLGKSLLAVEQAALRPEEELLPLFRIAFESGATIERYQVGEEKKAELRFVNLGKEIAEDVNLMIFFPPEFSLLTYPGYRIIKQRPRTEYPNHTAAQFTFKLIHSGFDIALCVKLKMPQTPDTYVIPVAVRARRIGVTEHKLTIEVV